MDRSKLIAALGATAQVMGQQVTDDALLLMADDLEGYTEQEIVNALKAVRRQRARFSIALIIDYIAQNDGRPSADQAWAKMPKDECESAVITDEMAGAWSVACEQYADGDNIGAQISFKREYQRFVDESRLIGNKVNWFPSLGYSETGRDEVLLEGVKNKQLGFEQVKGLISSYAIEEFARISGDKELLEFANTPPSLPPPEVEKELQQNSIGRELLSKLKKQLEK